jgi:hypothetical protein
MSSALKCPNPSCPYLFDPSRVPGGVVLTCPRCGMRFPLGPPPPVTAAAPAPTAAVDSSFASMGAIEPEAGPEEPLVQSSFPAVGKAGPLQTVIIAFICFVMLAGVGTMIYFRFIEKPSPLGGGSDAKLREHNLSFEAPPSPWAIDDDTRAKLGPPVILAFKRTNPDAYIAIGAKNFETRAPRPSELKSAMDRVLDRVFGEVRQEPRAGISFLGQPATHAFKFEAQSKDGPNVAGVCFATSYKGIGYWYLAWAGEKDAAEQEATFTEIRDKLKLDRYRENWTATDQPIRTFGGHALSYQVLDGEDMWKEPDEKERSAAGEDPNADLLLVAKVKQKRRDFDDEATLLAIILDGEAGDPLARARKYVEDQQTTRVKDADAKLMPAFIERTGAPDGDPPSNPVDTPTPVARLQMTVPGASNFSKLLVVSAIKIGDRIVVVEAWCAWKDREVFEAKLMQIAGSLRESR